ncbi:MAG: rRNA pseudouridine synthase [Bacteroidales bacterium]|nr:rRNA pseudouridine synthase [Bacteroidales bacterium]
MENNRNRGNSGYSDNHSRANAPRGGRNYQNGGNNYQRGNNKGFGGSRNRNYDNNGYGNGYGNSGYGNGNRYGNSQNDRYGNGNNSRYGNNQNNRYSNDRYSNGNDRYGNNQNSRYSNNGGYRRDNGGNGGYNNYNDGEPRRGNYSRQGSKYTVDEQGYHHKKYWDHSDRKKKAFEDAVEREDDFMEHDGKIRLNKYLANSGMCSRREADRLIKAGQVEVNGEIVTEMGVKVSMSDEVKFNGMIIKPEHKRYILLNKPKDYITTLKDPNARHTVMDLIEGACKERVYPVGRLDRNTTGVLLFTNDGDLAKKLTHPSNEIQKIYHVTTDKAVTVADIEKIAEGFELEDGFIKADEVGYLDQHNKCEVGIRIHSGRNRIVRRIFEYLGYDVEKLDRLSFAGLDKKGLGRGRWRFLSEKEVGFLYMISNKKAVEDQRAAAFSDDDINE